MVCLPFDCKHLYSGWTYIRTQDTCTCMHARIQMCVYPVCMCFYVRVYLGTFYPEKISSLTHFQEVANCFMTVIFSLVKTLLSTLPGTVLGTVHAKMSKIAHIM